MLYPVRVCSESPRQDKFPTDSHHQMLHRLFLTSLLLWVGDPCIWLTFHAPMEREFHSHDVSPASQVLPHLHLGAFSHYVWTLLASRYVASSVLLGYNSYQLAFSLLTESSLVQELRTSWDLYRRCSQEKKKCIQVQSIRALNN